MKEVRYRLARMELKRRTLFAGGALFAVELVPLLCPGACACCFRQVDCIAEYWFEFAAGSDWPNGRTFRSKIRGNLLGWSRCFWGSEVEALIAHVRIRLSPALI